MDDDAGRVAVAVYDDEQSLFVHICPDYLTQPTLFPDREVLYTPKHLGINSPFNMAS